MTVENEQELEQVMQYTRFKPDRSVLEQYGQVGNERKGVGFPSFY